MCDRQVAITHEAVLNGLGSTARGRPGFRRFSQAEGLREAGAATRRPRALGGHQQPDPAVIGGGQGSLQAARRDRRAAPSPTTLDRGGMRRDLASGPRERAQRDILLHVAGHNLSVADAPTHRRRHPARGRGGRIWRYFRAKMLTPTGGHAGRHWGSRKAARRFFAARIPQGVRAGKSHLIERGC